MAKKIRFPLIMDNGTAVNSVSELREHFSILRMLEYVSEEKEKLLEWLRDRYEEEIAEKIENLDTSDAEVVKKIHEIFGIEFTEQNNITLDDVKDAKEKREKLLQFTQDEDLLCHAAECAFEQDDVYDLLDAGKTTIYLCGEKFEIPISKKGISYIGIKINEKEPIAVIDSKEKIDFAERNISFEGIVFDEKYLKVCNVDAHIETVESVSEPQFLMPIESHQKTSRGTVVTGTIESGVVNLNDRVEILGIYQTWSTYIGSIEIFREVSGEKFKERASSATIGDEVELCFTSGGLNEVHRGQVVAAFESIKPCTRFTAQLHVLTEDEGGRHTSFSSGYQPQLYFQTTKITGKIILPKGMDKINPGDDVEIEIEPIYPVVVKGGWDLEIAEGNSTIALGKIIKVAK